MLRHNQRRFREVSVRRGFKRGFPSSHNFLEGNPTFAAADRDFRDPGKICIYWNRIRGSFEAFPAILIVRWMSLKPFVTQTARKQVFTLQILKKVTLAIQKGLYAWNFPMRISGEVTQSEQTEPVALQSSDFCNADPFRNQERIAQGSTEMLASHHN